ncbi:MAG: class II aldolase/adducin family protein [Ignavibacteria bacterium]|nr:class II aldolase/adducin family protein [Ignavibacteria bacterium]
MQQREELIAYCHKVYEKNFVSAYDGNLSVRTPNGTILITRSAVCKGDVTGSDILEMDINGNIISGSGKISTENKLHLFIYKNRNDVKAVVHAHPVYATAFASARESLDRPVFPEVILTLGRIPLCKYATPSTDELPDSLKTHINYANVFLLENHGAVSVGVNVKQAYFRMEKLEHTAKTIFIAGKLGGIKEIPKYKLDALYSVAEKSYGIKLDEKNKF